MTEPMRVSVMQRVAALNQLRSDAEFKPALNRATYRNKAMTVFHPENKISLPDGNHRQELKDVRMLGRVANFAAWSAPNNAQSPARGSALSVQRKSAEPAAGGIKQPPVAAPRLSPLAKAPPRKISAEEWDPIAAGKSATPVTLTKDPRALAMAARFANAVNGPNTRRPIPEGEKIDQGSVSVARNFFENKSNRSE